jgi:hypothetical protein
MIIFNRPVATERVFREVARARPKRLLLVADGPRHDRPGEAEKCAATRAIVERVDWECDVLKNYSEVNLGVGRRPATGLRWVFEQVEEAIILEDDCLPHPSFFRFCDELLAKYRDDERVMHISGDNWHFGGDGTPYSYFFSNYCCSWGWASWRRAFRHYDPDVKLWPALRETPWLLDILGDPDAVDFWKQKFDLATEGVEKADGWDWQWLFACWAHRGLSILPRTNLISNIGFSQEATHTRRANDRRADVPAVEMTFPLSHPPCMARHTRVDQTIFDEVARSRRPRTLSGKLRRACVAALPGPVRSSLRALRATWRGTEGAERLG